MEVVIAHKGNLLPVCRPRWHLLLATLGERLEFGACHRIDIIVGFERTAINALRSGLYEHLRAIGREFVAIKRIDGRTHGMLHIKQHSRLFAGLERILYNTLPIFADTGILVGTRNGANACQPFGSKSTVGNIFQGYLLCSFRCGKCH